MELEESPFRVIDAIYLRNMVHEVKVQEAMEENWIRDKQSFPYFLNVPGSSISAQGICSKYTILLGMKYHPFSVPNIKNTTKLKIKNKRNSAFCLKALKVCVSLLENSVTFLHERSVK